MVQIDQPLLYSYRRCPYAIRARMALCAAEIECWLHDISLRDKPAHLLQVSPKGTVPVLCLPDGTVLEQSLDIMRWALQVRDPEGWLDRAGDPVAQDLLTRNDGPFKAALDRYKYPARFEGVDPQVAREQAMDVLVMPLSTLLTHQRFIGGERPVLQDVAVFPFVRQFAAVDPDWFLRSVPLVVRDWLNGWLGVPLFARVMAKGPRLP